MATPDIGTSISEGYQRGLERMAAFAPSALVPALVMGLVAGAVSQAQTHFGVQVHVSMLSVDVKQTAGDRLVYNLLGLLRALVQVVIVYAGITIFAGAFHRARHEADATPPAPGAMVSELISTTGALMPKLGVLVALSVIGPLTGIVSNTLGGLVGFIAAVGSVYFTIRWLFVPVLLGSGEAQGDAAFTQSEETVEGSFWPYLGITIVVGIATSVPAAIVSFVLLFALPTTFLSYFVAATINMFAWLTIIAAALESMWAQVEGGPGETTDAFGAAQPEALPNHPRPGEEVDTDSDPYA